MAALRSVLERPFAPASPWSHGPGEGESVWIPWAPYLPMDASDQECAAVILARLGDRDSLPAIQEAAARFPFPSSRYLQQAIDSLEAQEGED